MPKSVTIRRVKRTHRRASTKEKILGGLGVGTTLLGGMGAISAKPPETQFIRAAETETGQRTGQLKQELKKLFGVTEARAAGAISGDEEVEVLSEEGAPAVSPAAAGQAGNLSPAEAYHSPQVLAQAQNKNSVQTFAFEASPGYPIPAGSGARYQGAAAAASNRTAEAEKTYTVKKGDTLWGISRRHYGDGRLWRNILNENPASLSRSGNVRTLRIGYVLTIPKLDENGSVVRAYAASPEAPAAENAAPVSAQIQSYNPAASAQGSVSSPFGLNLRGGQGQQSSPVAPAAVGPAANPGAAAAPGQAASSPAALAGQAAPGNGGIIYRPSGSDVGDDDKEVEQQQE